MRRLALLLVVLASLGCSATPPRAPTTPGPLADLHWLAGAWIATNGDTVTEEQWMSPAGEVMPGVGRTTRAGRVVEWEHVRLEARGGEVFYVALPSGQQEAAFKLVRRERERAVFEDAAHDYPQRIVYERAGEKLRARIELMSGERAHTWEFSPMR